MVRAKASELSLFGTVWLIYPRGHYTMNSVALLAEDVPLDLLEFFEPVSAEAKKDTFVVSTRGYPGAHFATFNPKLITPCILAGTSEHGCCAECGGPYERVVIRSGGISVDGSSENRDRSFPSQRNGLPGSNSTLDGVVATKETIGWRRVCGCQTDKVVPCTVLDPFVGSGTTVATSLLLGRAGVGIDLSEIYLRENAIPRIEAALSGGTRYSITSVMVSATPPPPRRLR